MMVELEPGSTLSHYRILGKLGQGGQATAFKAEDLRLNRVVVIKILRPDLGATDAARRRFEREACLCSALEHPNISAVYDVGETDGVSYIVMQYVEGKTLRELMAGRPLDSLSALSISIQIADALAVAHAHGIVHRDVKPGNVIVTPSGQAKVLDFGLAKMVGDEARARNPASLEPDTEVGVPYGSMGYGSPEQARGERVDHRSDIFSLGVLLYEMVTGQRPFRGRYPIEVLNAVIHETPRPLVAQNPKVPPRLQAIVDRALAKTPNDRFQTMAALRDELKAMMRQLTRDSGVVPTEASSTLLSPRRSRSPWALSGTLGRVFGRFRGLPLGVSEPRTDPARIGRPPGRPPSWGSETRKTIAVLPFKNLSGDPEAAFYEFSLADGIITELAHVNSLVVRPSSYIAQYVGQNVAPGQVGEELAVAAVLAGSFIKAPDRFRVTAQLVATETGEILWSEKIDIAARDLITIQDTIVERVVTKLRLNLTADEQEKIYRLPTVSAEAYEYYLRGRDRLFKYTLHTLDDTDLEAAIQMFNEAIGLDPHYARAHTALGRCYVHHAQGYGGSEYFTLAERSLRRALELDPGQVDARIQMVYVDLHHGDKDRARSAIEDLRREYPNDPAVLFVAGMVYRLDGLYEKALEQYDRLLEINPQDIVLAGYSRARIHTHLEHYEEAIAELERARSLEPDHPLVKTFLAVAYFNQGRVEEAQMLVEEVLRQHPHLDGVQPVLAWCLSAQGQHEEARALVTERVKETGRADHDIAFWLASFYAMENLPDEALEWGRLSVRLGNENYPLFAASKKLDNLRGNPLFGEFLEDLKRRWDTRSGDLSGAGMTEETPRERPPLAAAD